MLTRLVTWSVIFTAGIVASNYGEKVYKEAMRPLAQPTVIAQKLMDSVKTDSKWAIDENGHLANADMHLTIKEGFLTSTVMDGANKPIEFCADDLRQINRKFADMKKGVQDRLADARLKEVDTTLGTPAEKAAKANEEQLAQVKQLHAQVTAQIALLKTEREKAERDKQVRDAVQAALKKAAVPVLDGPSYDIKNFNAEEILSTIDKATTPPADKSASK